MRRVDAVTFVARRGIDGDAAADGHSTRQVLLVSRETSALLGAEPGALRENVCLDGLAVDDTASGTVLRVGDALLRLTFPCDPCGLLRRYTGITPAQAWGLRGMLAVVVADGHARIGDDAQDCGIGYPSLPAQWRDRLGWFLQRLPADLTITYGALTSAVGQFASVTRSLPRLLSHPEYGGLPVERVVAASAPGRRWAYWEALYEPLDTAAEAAPAAR